MTKLSQSVAKDRITIGKVGAAHGIHGEMRIIPLTDFIERFASMKSVMVDDELLHVEQVRYDKQYILMKFREYSVREDAMCLTNKLLTVARSEAAPLAEGEFYAFDIFRGKVVDLIEVAHTAVIDIKNRVALAKDLKASASVRGAYPR